MERLQLNLETTRSATAASVGTIVLNDGKMDETQRSLRNAFTALDERRAELDQAIETGNTTAARQLIHECQKLAARIDQLRAKEKG